MSHLANLLAMHDNIGMVSKLVLRHARWSVLLLAAGFFCTVSSSFGQKTDVNINLYGAFPTSASGPGEVSPITNQPGPPLHQTTDPSAGFRIGVRHIFSPILGLELNFGYNSATQHFTGAPFQTGVVYSHGKPFTVDYVASAPFTFHGVRPFLLAGGGFISYNISSYVALPPGTPGNIPARPEKIPAFEYGIGVDYHPGMLPNFMSMRFQYRGLIAHAPDYRLPYLQTNNFTNIAEPQVGLVFKF